jgi:hypothetical protein
MLVCSMFGCNRTPNKAQKTTDQKTTVSTFARSRRGDLLIGPQRSAIGTLVERTTGPSDHSFVSKLDEVRVVEVVGQGIAHS